MAKYAWTSESVVELNAKSSVHPIHGEIRQVRGEAEVEVKDGQIQLDPAPSAFIESDVDQLQTGKKLEDIALRKQIEAKKFPTVRYELQSVTGGPERFQVTGAFTFHGQTQQFSEEATARIDGDALHVEAEHTFDIRDFGVQPFKILSLKIEPDVNLKLHLVAKPAGSSLGWG